MDGYDCSMNIIKPGASCSTKSVSVLVARLLRKFGPRRDQYLTICNGKGERLFQLSGTLVY